MKSSGFTLNASSFSGDVRVTNSERFPTPTGPVIQQMESVVPRLETCADQQLKRTPGASGHAVLTLKLEEDGSVVSAKAPATSSNPADIEDGAYSACLVRAVDKLQFEAGGSAEIRWPVAFHPPVIIEPVSPPSGALSPVVDVRRVPIR
jgi:hypothetical protein